MHIPVHLRNQSAGVPTDDLSLRVGYFVNGQNGDAAPKTASYDVPANGEVSVDLGTELALQREVFFTVLANETNTLTQLSTVGDKLREGAPLVIDFDYHPVALGEASDAEPPRQPLFAYGRLLERSGTAKLEDVQIVFQATRPGETTSEAIASVRTEANGYFAIEYPSEPFASATALVGMRITENPVPIRLEPPANGAADGGLAFPRRILLVVELATDAAADGAPAAAGESDCGCSSLDMHAAKRVLEEYSFYSLVRTTEPEIKGFVLEEADDITLDDLIKHHPIRIGELLEPIVHLQAFAAFGMSRFTGAPLASHALTSVAASSAGGGAATAESPDLTDALKSVRIKREVLSDFLSREQAVTKDNIVELLDLNDAYNFRHTVKPLGQQPLGRVVLDGANAVDWDQEPTLYQAVSVAHGHLLHYKSEWVADGYSLGDLIYSLPLAPGQKKQVVVFDWERRESASNVQSLDYEESLYNSLGRDRDIAEITRGVVQEHSRGRSSATTASASAAAGGFLGGVLFGVSGGVGHSSSNASQDSLRQTSASDLQKIRDRIVQSSNAVRSQRSTVVQTVAQGERFEVSSESVANYNHCHAITIQYFEVLRHFRVRHRLADARECLFVPLLMTRFDLAKALRWRESLVAGLLDARFAKAFDAAERVRSRWRDADFPSGSFASEKILTAAGSFRFRFVLRRPDDQQIEVDDYSKPIIAGGIVAGYQKKTVDTINEANWQGLVPFLGATTPKAFYDQYLKDSTRKDDVFHELLGEKIATAFVNSLSFHVADEAGHEIGTIPFDPALTSRYRREGSLNVSVHFAGPSAFSRDKVHFIKMRCGASALLPSFSTVTVESGFVRYRSAHYEGFLFNFQSINDDLSPSDGVTLYAGPTADELRDPRKEDLAAVNALLDHLNDNLERYHAEVWKRLPEQRRFLLLDGIILPPSSKGNGRSLASLVENELIGIVGNSLVFPVAQGLNLDPNFGLKDSLLDYYMVSPADPVSVSVPTKGVFAEAMMGSCNSCEVKDESRFWRWEESPIPDSPTAIQPISTDSRRAEPGNLAPAAFPNPIVNIQNAPAAPDPTGLAGTMALLGKGDTFRDLTGLAANQTNALESLKASFDTTQAFGQEAAKIETLKIQEAAKLEMQKLMDRRLDTALSKIKGSGLPADKQALLTEKALTAYLGGGATQESAPKTDAQKVESAKAKTSAIKTMVDDGVLSPSIGESLAKATVQHALFGASEEVTPGTIEARDLLSDANAAGRDVAFDNGTFRFASTGPMASPNGAGGASGGSGAVAGSGTGGGSGTAAPPSLLTRFIIVNNCLQDRPRPRRLVADPVNGVTVTVTPASGGPLSASTTRTNTVSLDLGEVDDGDFEVEVQPADAFAGGADTSIGDPATNPPDRLWIPYTALVTKTGTTFTSTDPRVSIDGARITVRLQPKWMRIAASRARTGGAPTMIVVHHTDDFNYTTDASGSYVYDAGFHSLIDYSLHAWINNNYAPHYVIDRDGSVIKLGHESLVAWHASPSMWGGQRDVNDFSVGIEIVHTNNVNPQQRPTYTEDFTAEQYASLLALLEDLTSTLNIDRSKIMGHSDVGSDGVKTKSPLTKWPIDVVGRKSGDPGRKFDWSVLENAGLGMQRMQGPIDFTTVYGGFFHAHPTGRIRDGEPGVTTAMITELRNDLTTIGYPLPAGTAYDAPVRRCIMVFCEHFMSIDGQDSVSRDIAEVVKRIVGGMP